MAYEDISLEFKKKFLEMARNARKIAVTAHMHPDDDSIGSVISMYSYLIENAGLPKSRVEIVYSGDGAERFERVLGYNKIRFVKDIADILSKYDLLIILDASGWHRISLNKGIAQFAGKRISIDHHPVSENSHNLHLLAPQYTSTCEIIYRQFFAHEEMSRQAAEAILLGILGDTGNFRFIDKNTTGVMDVAKGIIEKYDIQIDAFKSRYDYINLESLKVLARLINNIKIIKVEEWPPFLYTYLDLEYAASTGDEGHIISEGKAKFIDYIKSVKDIGWGFVIVPRGRNTCNVSFRSEPDSVNVRLVAERMEIGSGHDHASGATIKTANPKDAADMMIRWLENNKREE